MTLFNYFEIDFDHSAMSRKDTNGTTENLYLISNMMFVHDTSRCLLFLSFFHFLKINYEINFQMRVLILKCHRDMASDCVETFLWQNSNIINRQNVWRELPSTHHRRRQHHPATWQGDYSCGSTFVLITTKSPNDENISQIMRINKFSLK